MINVSYISIFEIVDILSTPNDINVCWVDAGVYNVYINACTITYM